MQPNDQQGKWWEKVCPIHTHRKWQHYIGRHTFCDIVVIRWIRNKTSKIMNMVWILGGSVSIKMRMHACYQINGKIPPFSVDLVSNVHTHPLKRPPLSVVLVSSVHTQFGRHWSWATRGLDTYFSIFFIFAFYKYMGRYTSCKRWPRITPSLLLLVMSSAPPASYAVHVQSPGPKVLEI